MRLPGCCWGVRVEIIAVDGNTNIEREIEALLERCAQAKCRQVRNEYFSLAQAD